MPGDDEPQRIESGAPSKYRMYIGGEWCDSESGNRRGAYNPASGESIGTVPSGTRADARRAIAAARSVQQDLERMSPFERAEIAHELGDAIEERLDHLAEWLTRDQGKPLSEATAEVALAAEMYHGAAEDIKRDEPPTLASQEPDKHIFTLRKPHGVCGVITPWNYPFTIPSEYLAPGIAVGNAIVWVPAPTTSVVSIKLMEVFDDTALPDGAINLVTGEGPVVGDEIVSQGGTDAIGFTGSPETGEHVASAAGAKPTLLELGGNGPVIVLDDADVEAAARTAAFGCFANAGQICTASERILVQEGIYEEFAATVIEYAEHLTIGDPMEDSTEMGPLNNEDVASKMDQHVADALDRGATLETGGHRYEDFQSDLYYAPTVLTSVDKSMVVNHEETFGPIAPLIRFETDEEAIDIANSIDLGLSSGVFTRSIDRMYYFAERLQTGLVNINDGSASWEIHTPIGGYSGKHSGVGRIGGRFTLEELSQLKTIAVNVGSDR